MTAVGAKRTLAPICNVQTSLFCKVHRFLLGRVFWKAGTAKKGDCFSPLSYCVEFSVIKLKLDYMAWEYCLEEFFHANGSCKRKGGGASVGGSEVLHLGNDAVDLNTNGDLMHLQVCYIRGYNKK